MSFSHVKKGIGIGKGVYNQTLMHYPGIVIDSVAQPGLLNRYFPSFSLRSQTDRHQRAAIREAVGWLKEPLVAYGAFRRALEREGPLKALYIAKAAGIDNDPHVMAVLDRHYSRKDGRPSPNQRYCDARRFDKEEASRQAEWYQDSLSRLEKGTSWERLEKQMQQQIKAAKG